MSKIKNAVMAETLPEADVIVELDLSKYAKQKSVEIPWTTSVSLTQRHRAYLERKDVNFSELVRDLLDALIARNE